jgi:hypothetical protein
MSKATDDVLAERQRQISEEGWTPEHDDEHVNGELAQAAACYADYSVLGEDMIIELSDDGKPVPGGWPWASSWWKPKDPRSDLVRAGALILAEIERLDRQQSSEHSGNG